MTNPSHDLNYIRLLELNQSSASLKFLRSDHLEFAGSFLYQQFRKVGRNRVPEPALRLALAQYLDRLKDQGIPFPDGATAKSYIDQWVQKKYLGRFFLADGETEVIELRSDIIRVIDFLQRLEKSSFVGAESKMKSIFDSLKNLAVQTNVDPKARVDELLKQRHQIDEEIQKIQSEGRAEVLTSTQVKERIARLDDDLSSLFGDFREITENFHGIARTIHLHSVQAERNRGELLGDAIDANQSLIDSDQGRSFQGFMRYLQSQDLRDEALVYMDRIQKLPEAAIIFKERYGSESIGLRRRFYTLTEPAQQVNQASSFLIEKVRGAVSVSRIQEGKALDTILNEILAIFAQEPLEHKRVLEFYHVEDGCEVGLPVDRPLWAPRKILKLKKQPKDVVEAEPNSEHVRTAFSVVPIDLTRLRKNIEVVASGKSRTSIGDVISAFPCKQGFREWIAYVELFHSIEGCEVEMNNYERIGVFSKSRNSDELWRVPKVSIPGGFSWRIK